jgi:23S rRNA (uracil1939-C5)-methyltransferase
VIGLGARGDGLTSDGRFVGGAVPGDMVMEDGGILPGPGRVVPPCPHFGGCGGCQLQHVHEALLADFARTRCLQPIAAMGIVPEEVMPVHLSPPGARRRASLRASWRDGRVVLGFSAKGSHALVDIGACPVLDRRLEALLPPLRDLLGRIMPRRGAARVTLGLADQGADVLLGDLAPDRLALSEQLVVFARAEGLARLAVAEPLGIETVYAPVQPTVTLGGVALALPAGAFLQATADGEAALVAAVGAATSQARRVADLFAGLGTFALPLALAARVHAVDGAGPPISALARAAATACRPITTEHRDLFRRPLLANELQGFDAVVFDPPRAGALAQSVALAASRVPVVVAVSCNPATFARDAERLVAGGYRLERLWPVAQFRWSTHVELVAAFRRTKR